MVADERRTIQDRFARFARVTALWTGHPLTFSLSVLMIVAWAASGPLFGWGDTWQLVINTITTVLTFLMVFVIQNTQNRDSEALHLKLDEILRSQKGTNERLIDIEEAPEEEARQEQEEFRRMGAAARNGRERVDDRETDER